MIPTEKLLPDEGRNHVVTIDTPLSNPVQKMRLF